MKQILFLFGSILFLLTNAGCQRNGSERGDAGNSTGNIKVGVYVDLTGQFSGTGQSIKNGVELARDEINQAGGINGRQLELIVEDDRGLPDGGGAAVARMVEQNHVQAIIGDASPGVLAAATKAQEAKVPLLTTSATDPKVTGVGDYVFRVSFLDSFQGEAMAKYAANNLHAKTAAILSESNSDYSSALAQAFDENFNKLGGQVTQKLSYAQADENFKGELTAIRDANPDVLYIPGRYTQVGRIAKQVKELGVKATLLGGDGWNNPQLFQVDANALDGSYITALFSANDPEPQVRKFTSDYAARFGGQPDAD